MSETNQEAFDRGHHEGGVEARLDQHEAHLKTINGSITAGVTGLAEVRSVVQQLGSDVNARLDTVIATAQAAAATVIATAEALKAADEARRDADDESHKKSDRTWTPFQRVFAVIAAVAASVVIWATLFRRH